VTHAYNTKASKNKRLKLEEESTHQSQSSGQQKQKFQFQPTAYDTMTIGNTIHHMKPQQQVLNNMVRTHLLT
jgi:hypothetical protein